jgi:diadenosine tetraphosphate (Ap4A) HIT family hydrolase
MMTTELPGGNGPGGSPFLEVPPAAWMAANRLAFAIWDSFPVSPGHALVIPRRLISSWWEATDEERHDLIALIDEVRKEIKHRFAPDGFNVGFNAGAAAGQTVPHLHLHVIPRYGGDVDDPRGGIRHVMPGKGNYLTDAPTREAAPPQRTYFLFFFVPGRPTRIRSVTVVLGRRLEAVLGRKRPVTASRTTVLRVLGRVFLIRGAIGPCLPD